MSIKEKIGKRIKDERIAKGLTRKALAGLTDDLNVSRINNYERGERTPGPLEIKQLARALEVSPAFLMCLSDDKQGALKKSPGLGALIPILTYQQACNPIHTIDQIKEPSYSEKLDLIPIAPKLSERVSEYAFALEVQDSSMTPEFRVGDILIVDPQLLPKPGDFIVAKLNEDKEILIRKYKQLSAVKMNPEFELIALNEDWAKISVNSDITIKIIGTVVSLNRIII
ncbi:phage repressor [Legionella busanensis]|uniref:Phage repressor n=1 Tax=Legionella busanensis TaxID=190655 RepID=A0A378JKV4_9GAMM|nr:XRE family transcriptional regulator [Legionella busanensis]STX50943.1 phage repressor [Legionella busanensis]